MSDLGSVAAQSELRELRDKLGRAENAMRNIRRLCDDAEELTVTKLASPGGPDLTITETWWTLSPDEVRWLLDQVERPHASMIDEVKKYHWTDGQRPRERDYIDDYWSAARAMEPKLWRPRT